MESSNIGTTIMKKDIHNTIDKKIKHYSQEFLAQAELNLTHNPKKLARLLFSNDINITKSYLVKFVKYYVNKSQYQYMKTDSRFDTNKLISKMLKKLPTKRTMNRLSFYDFASEFFMEESNQHMIYGEIASKIAIHKIHKTTSSSIKHVVNKLYNENNNIKGQLSPLISKEYYDIVMKHYRKIQNKIDYSRDYLFDYFGFQTLLRAYLLKIHKKDWVKFVERPQHLWMRVAIGIHGYDLDAAFETYDLFSLRYMTHATPTLFNAGTPKPQMSSCFLNGSDDNLDSIIKLIGESMHISKWAGGIGTHLSSIRGNGSIIRGTNGKSNGIIPLCRMLNELAKYINQGGKRKGSIATYLEEWHCDIEDFIQLRSIKGSDTLRARDLFLGLWVSDLFMKRVHSGEMWSLMCPDECPGLNKVHGEEFEKLYEEYESKGMYKKQLPAIDLMRRIMEMQIETGFPYFLYKDHANRKSNQKNLGTIRSSNLCTEIIEYSDADETAVCNLASICLPNFIKQDPVNNKKIFDYEYLGKVTRIIVRNLNKVIDRNYYPTESAKKSNLRHRPMGIGVQGLADLYNIMGYSFDSKKARLVNKKVFETIYYYALDESKEIAKKCGQPYESFQGSPTSQGILQWHMWGLSEDDLHMKFNWNKLIEDIKLYGLRNSLLTALMPTASTSQIMGNSECIEPYMSNIFVRSTLAGEYIIVNKNLMEDLEKEKLLSTDIIKKLLIYNGSVQEIEEIPKKLKNVYKTAFEINPKTIVNQSAERGPFICQSQSLNHFIAQPSYDVLYGTLRSAWKKGLKTAMYYYRGVPSVNPIQFGVDIDDVKRLTGNDNMVNLLTSTKNNVTFDDTSNTSNTSNTKNKKMTPMISQKNKGSSHEIEECLACGS
jgi:ribonucleoside-diphosphate reductase alpha subunit